MPPVLSKATRELLNRRRQQQRQNVMGMTQDDFTRLPVGFERKTPKVQQQAPGLEERILERRQRQEQTPNQRTIDPRIPTSASIRLQHETETRDFALPYMRQHARLEDIRGENQAIQQAKQMYNAQLNQLQSRAFGQAYLGNVKAGGRRSQLIQAARRFLGTPYSWGGGGPGGPSRGIGRGANTVGFDCSGLVQYAYSQIGIKVPRVSYGQLRTGSRRAIQNLLPGDLVGFGNGGHVAIYMGNGRIIESPRTGLSVRTRKLTPSDYKRAWGVHINI